MIRVGTTERGITLHHISRDGGYALCRSNVLLINIYDVPALAVDVDYTGGSDLKPCARCVAKLAREIVEMR